MKEIHKTITEEEVEKWVSLGWCTTPEKMNISRLHEILIGKYSLEEAREDILSFRKKEVEK